MMSLVCNLHCLCSALLPYLYLSVFTIKSYKVYKSHFKFPHLTTWRWLECPSRRWFRTVRGPVTMSGWPGWWQDLTAIFGRVAQPGASWRITGGWFQTWLLFSIIYVFFQRGSTTNQIMFTEKHLKQISHHISSVPSKVASETLEVIPSTPDHLTVGQARTSQLACRTCTSCGPRLGEISTVKIWPSNRLLYIYICMLYIYMYVCMYVM